MFSRWGIEGMKSFEQVAVREKELPRYTLDQTPSGTVSADSK